MNRPRLPGSRRRRQRKLGKYRRKTDKTASTHETDSTTGSDRESGNPTGDTSTLDKSRKRDVKFWKACRDGDLRKVNLLLKRGADVNTRYYLPEAKYDNQLGRDTDEENRDSNSDVDEAKQTETEKVSAIFAAIVTSHFDIASRLLDEDNIELQDGFWEKGTTSLHQAVARKEGTALVEKFVKRRDAPTFVDKQSNEGWTPLHIAVSWGYAESARLLLRHGASVNCQGKETGDTPLALTTRCVAPQDIVVARLLLVHGADISIPNNDGDTALHLAAMVAEVGLMELLIGWGADLEARNKKGHTPHDVAKSDRYDAKWVFKRAHTLKNELQQPWEPRDKTPAVCGKFDVAITFFCNRASAITQAETHFRSVDRFLYKAPKPSSDTKSGKPRPPERTELESLERTFYDYLKSNQRSTRRNDIWKWIHIPTNNMTWVKELVANIGHGYSKERLEDRWYMRNFVEETVSARRERSGDGQAQRRSPHVQYHTSPGSSGDQTRVSLVVPYLDFETEEYLRRGELAAQPAGYEAFANMVDLEREYKDFDGSAGLQRSQTLDESFYGTSDTERDRDQVVYKWFNSINKTDRPGNGETTAKVDTGSKVPGSGNTESKNMRSKKLLMVNQLWLWKLDDRTIITAGLTRWHDGLEFTLLDTIRRSLTKQSIWRNPDSLIRQILLQSLRFPDEFEYAGVGYHVLDIFESWIAKLVNEEVVCFKSFQYFFEKNTRSSGTRASPSNQQINIDALSITQEIELIYETKDVLDELFTLRQLFATQTDVVNGYSRYDEDLADDFLERCRVSNFIDKTRSLEDKSRRVLESLDRLVEMKLGEIAIIEAQNSTSEAQKSTLEAQKSRELSIYVAFFTIVTIVFTPLSFMTSLFSLSIDDFPRNDAGEPRYSSSWITRHLFAGELVSLIFMVGGLAYLLWRVRTKNKKGSGSNQQIHPLYETEAAPGSRAASARASYLSARSSLQSQRPGEASDGDAGVGLRGGLADGLGLRFGLSRPPAFRRKQAVRDLEG